VPPIDREFQSSSSTIIFFAPVLPRSTISTVGATALLANEVDNSSAAIVYDLSRLALSRSRVWKRTAARFSGVMLLVFACDVIVDAARRFIQGSAPVATVMMTMAAVAGVANLLSLYLLKKRENRDVNLRAATTFSVNDFVSNGGIILAGIAVILTGSHWPDLLVGTAVAGIALYGGVDILRDAHQDVHEERGTVHDGRDD